MITWFLLLFSPLLFSPLLADKTPCKVCRELTTSFQEHFDKTVGQNFGGGNTAWEEKSLGTYAKSETRLVEILEKASKSKDCDYKCSSLLENEEEYMEDWFHNRQDKTDLFEEMCVERLKRCCLKNRWGTECQECPGGTDTPCSGHGSCHGEGDREDPSTSLHGTCTCDKGYNGTLCEDCKSNFIRVGEICEECSSLCDGQCVAPGSTGCTKCVKGYELVEGTGCTDINECQRPGSGCGDPELEDCVNSVGSFECVCKTGYQRVGGKCQLEELYSDEDEEDDVPEIEEVPTEDASESYDVTYSDMDKEQSIDHEIVDIGNNDDDEYDEIEDDNDSDADNESSDNVAQPNRFTSGEL